MRFREAMSPVFTSTSRKQSSRSSSLAPRLLVTDHRSAKIKIPPPAHRTTRPSIVLLSSCEKVETDMAFSLPTVYMSPWAGGVRSLPRQSTMVAFASLLRANISSDPREASQPQLRTHGRNCERTAPWAGGAQSLPRQLMMVVFPGLLLVNNSSDPPRREPGCSCGGAAPWTERRASLGS